MKHSVARHAMAVAGVTGLLLVSACSDDEGGASGSSGSDLTAEDSPLQAYLGDIFSMDNDQMIAEQTAVEEAVAQCMADEGFEYVIPDVAAQYSDMSTGSEEDWNSEEWIATNGYGMTGVVEDEPVDEGDDPWADPNAEYIESLSEASMTAYYTALHGTWEPPEGLTEDEEMEWMPALEDQGCYGTARHEVVGEEVWDDPAFDAVNDASDDMYEEIAKNPRIADIDAAWADCMADAGYTGFSKQTDAFESISEAQSALWEDVVYDETDPEAEVGPDPAAEAELRELELATALADFTCKEEVGYDDVMLEVQFAAEEQFVADHKAELDALIAAYEK